MISINSNREANKSPQKDKLISIKNNACFKPINIIRNKSSQIKFDSSTISPLYLLEKELGIKIKNKRDPLPMKLRALPTSFWQQPNQLGSESPAPILPPLLQLATSKDEDTQDITLNKSTSMIVSDANTELLFSLFREVENDKMPVQQKRGRPKKTTKNSQMRDDDPCLVSAGLLPPLNPVCSKPDHPKNINYSQILNDLVFHL